MQTSSQQSMDNTIQTRDQGYALDAYKQVKTFKTRSKAERDRYGSMAHKLPVLIRIAGLTQALAYVEARGKREHKCLLDDLAHTLKKQSGEHLVEAAINASLSEYIYLTQ